jgi:hypothetical protein
MRTARLVMEKEKDGYDIRLYFKTYPSGMFQDKISILVSPARFYTEYRLQYKITILHKDLHSNSFLWDGAFIRYSLRKAAQHNETREEIYPSSLKNKHILTVKQSIKYAWRNRIKILSTGFTTFTRLF